MIAPLAWATLPAAPCIGSLLGVLIRRLPAGRPVAWARSECESCGHPLGPLELVPLLSYAAQRGRCRHCAARISPFHPAVELAALLVPLTAMAAGITAPADLWSSCALGWTLLALAWIDVEHFLLPDVLTLPLILAGLANTWRTDPTSLTDHAAATALAYASLRTLNWLYRRLRHRDGIGEGDAKLLAAGGAWIGTSAIAPTLMLAVAMSLALPVMSLLRNRRLDLGTQLPFGTPLAAAIWLATLVL